MPRGKVGGPVLGPGGVFRVARGRTVLVFWTVIGCVLVAAGLATYGAHAVVPAGITVQPALVFLGLLTVAYVQLVYPAVTWLAVGEKGFVLRTLSGRRSVPWAQVGRLEAASALAPAGRGGNLSDVRVRDRDGGLILIVPDVFEAGREGVLAVMEPARANRSDLQETQENRSALS